MIEHSESAPAGGWREQYRRDWERIKGWLGFEPGRLGRRFLVLAAVLWAIEWYVVQEWTFGSFYPRIDPEELATSQIFRMGRNLLFAFALLFGLPRIGAYLAFGIWGLFAASALAYHAFFQRALNFQTLKTSLLDGFAVAGAGIDLVGGKTLLVLALLAAVKVAIVSRDRSRVRIRWRLGAIALAAWMALGGWANAHIHEVRLLVKNFSFERMAAAYGYLWTWAGEEIHLGGQVLERAVEVARTKRSNRLAGEFPLPGAEKVAIVQMESIEFETLGLEFEGELVMPFLASLRENSRVYRVRSIHDNGSADADFSMLTGKAPSPDVITYRIRGYPYEDPLPSLFRRAGYRTEFYHGLYGDFFARRPVMEKYMGFDAVTFEEEIVAAHDVIPTRWGLMDRDVFRLAARELNAAEGPVFQFIITLTSHSPYDFLPEEERELTLHLEKGSKDELDLRRLRYIDSARYVDRVLQEYVEALPDGSLVILYGDHSSFALPRTFRDLEGNLIEFIPYIVHQKGARLESADPKLALGGTLTQLDMVTYIRNHALGLAAGASPETALAE